MNIWGLAALAVLGSLASDSSDKDKEGTLLVLVSTAKSDLFNEIGLGWIDKHPMEVIQTLRRLNVDTYKGYEEVINTNFGGSKKRANRAIQEELKNLRKAVPDLNFEIYGTSHIDSQEDIIRYIGKHGWGFGLFKPKNPEAWVEEQIRELYKPYRNTLSNEGREDV